MLTELTEAEALKVVLVRHAAVTVDPGVPVEDWALSPDGAKMAALLGQAPALADVDVFFTSPEPKAVATANAIAGVRQVVQVADLRELDRRAAGWIGSPDGYTAMVMEIFEHPDRHVHGCETAADAQRRIARAIDSLAQVHAAHPFAVVSHGIVLTLYLSDLLGFSRPDPATWRSIGFPDLAVVDPEQRKVIVGFSGPRALSG